MLRLDIAGGVDLPHVVHEAVAPAADRHVSHWLPVRRGLEKGEIGGEAVKLLHRQAVHLVRRQVVADAHRVGQYVERFGPFRGEP